MKVGVPAEVSEHELRVAVTPAGVHELARAGHAVFIEAGAGAGSALPDADFAAAGATVLPAAGDVWEACDLVLKVEPPLPREYGLMRPGQVLFAFLHLAASAARTAALLDRGVTAIACETVQRPDGSLPLLAPMSEVAGRMAVQVGARCLRAAGGRTSRIVVLGAGTAGLHAAAAAVGLHAEVLVLDRNFARLRRADALYPGRCQTARSSGYEVERAVWEADLVIGAAGVPGGRAPALVGDELVAKMKPGSVLVDVAIDQGGCFAGSRPTTHADPTYRVHDSVFYCVPNMPGAVPHTSTYALASVTLPYALQLAGRGWRGALRNDDALARGLSAHAGALTCLPVGRAHGLACTDPGQVTGRWPPD